MNIVFLFRQLTAACCATMFLFVSVNAANAQAANGQAPSAPAAKAQVVSEAHLNAARKAIAAIGATNQFDEFLPALAVEIKTDLINNNPNQQSTINKVVDEQVLAIVKRRGELETDAARIYAKYFTEQELNQITAFYQSSTGKKLLKSGPLAMADTMGAFAEWRKKIVDELSTNIEKALGKPLVKE